MGLAALYLKKLVHPVNLYHLMKLCCWKVHAHHEFWATRVHANLRRGEGGGGGLEAGCAVGRGEGGEGKRLGVLKPLLAKPCLEANQ